MQPTPAPPRSQSLLATLLRRLATIEPHELPAVVAAFLLFFFMWGGYFAVRPVRETIGTVLGREQVADLWVVTWLGSLLIIPFYGAIVARFRRSVFLPATYGVVALVLGSIGFAMGGDQIDPLLGKFFYVFISVVNLFLISMFWSFLLELFNGAQTKRLFGVIAAGGSAGALTGPLISDLTVNQVGNSGVLFIGAGMFVAAIICQRSLLSIWKGQGDVPAAQQQDRPIGGNMFAGITLILRSPYILGIALFVVFIATVNTLLYFEQLRLVQIYFPDTTDRTRVFARLDWIVQSLTVLSQVLITGRIAQRFGVIALVTAVPVAMIVGFLALAAGFMAFPLPAEALEGSPIVPASFTIFGIFAAVFVLRRASEYAFVRPGREMLWSSLDKETKYKAKNTVDVPVYRAADVVAAQVNNAVSAAGAGATGVALLGAAVAAAWAGVGYWLGRRHDRAAASGATTQPSSAARDELPIA